MNDERRSGLDRRSNWLDAVERLNKNRIMFDALLIEIDKQLKLGVPPAIEQIQNWKIRLNTIIQVSRM